MKQIQETIEQYKNLLPQINKEINETKEQIMRYNFLLNF
jgi:hypothetical protein